MLSILCYLVIVGTIIAVMLVRPHRSLPTAVAMSVVVQVLVPSFYAPSQLQLISCVAGAATLIIGLARSGARLSALVIPGALTVYLAVIWFGMIRDNSLDSAILGIATIGFLILLAISARQLGVEGLRILLFALCVSVLVQLLFATAEQVGLVDSFWARTGASNYIENRRNHVFVNLAGRSIGTLGQPIPLGIFASFTLVALLACRRIFAHRLRLWWLSIAAAAVLLCLSGTRSAIIAALVGVLILAAAWFRLRYLLVYVAISALALWFLLTNNLGETLGFGASFEQSGSYGHRSLAFIWIEILLRKNPDEVLFGGGYLVTQRMFASGELPGIGITVFDQELIKNLAAYGVIGVAILVIVVIQTAVVGRAPTRAILAVLVTTFFTFDTLSWRIGLVLFVLTVSGVADQGLSDRPTRNRQLRRRVNANVVRRATH